MGIIKRLSAVALLAAIGAGCGSSDALPILSDPHEVVSAAGVASAGLQSIHAQIDLSIGAGDQAGGASQARALVEADIDVQGRNVAGRSQFSQQQGGNLETSEFVLLERTIFSRTLPAVRWNMNPNPGNADHLPTNPGYLALIEREIAAGRITLDLADAVACGEATCYRVLATLDSEAAWTLLLAPITGDRPGAAVADRSVTRVHPATLELFVDQATRQLTGLTARFGADETTIAATITFSAPDAPVQIAAPPPQLVDGGLDGGAPIAPPPAGP